MGRTGLLLAVLLAFVSPAQSHSWYPSQCCHERDCFGVPDDAVALTKAGWLVRATGEIVPLGRAAYSPDGRFHRCTAEAAIGGRTLCLFVPRNGS
jgi:hypothetical protein